MGFSNPAASQFSMQFGGGPSVDVASNKLVPPDLQMGSSNGHRVVGKPSVVET
jgi:hypothetical protein